MNISESEFYNKLNSNFTHVLDHENPESQEKARQCIQLDKLMIETHKKLARRQLDSEYFRELLVCDMMHWFKNEFFTWMDSPKCDKCNADTIAVGSVAPSSDDIKHGANRVEGYKCALNCSNHITRFPRYNSPEKLLQTRTGRCGEWANCFLLCLRAIGVEARLVVNWLDHVWNEVYIERLSRWVHLDVCEDVWDQPLLYELGWGTKLNYCVAFSKDEIQDVTWKYCTNHLSTLNIRKACRESWLVATLVSMRKQRWRNFTASAVDALNRRIAFELVEMLVQPQASEGAKFGGRSTGSVNWRMERGELGCSATEFIIHPTDGESKLGLIDLKYDCNSDSYLRGENDVVSCWNSLIYSAHNIYRKVEKDWKKVYLCRNENCRPIDAGQISWKFRLPGNSKIQSLHVAVGNTRYESASVDCDVCASKNKLMNIQQGSEDVIGRSGGLTQPYSITLKVEVDNNLKEVMGVEGYEEVEIKIKLSGGNGELAWQHAQICRQDLNSSDALANYTLRFILKFN